MTCGNTRNDSSCQMILKSLSNILVPESIVECCLCGYICIRCEEKSIKKYTEMKIFVKVVRL